jgi:CRISPR-associated protein Cas1
VSISEPNLLPARMLNEHVYCPRLCYLEWVQGEFLHSADTREGSYLHRRVDQPRGVLPAPDDDDAIGAVRSLTLSSQRLGTIAKLDILEYDGGVVVPVEYKRGRPPAVPNAAYDPERVQVCLQGLILRDNGFICDEGAIYFQEAKIRVPVPFTPALVAMTERHVHEARNMAEAGQIPPPLVDSPKCQGCSLAPLCLPDELNSLNKATDARPVRRLLAAADTALPLIVSEPGAFIGKDGEVLVIKVKGEKVAEAKLYQTSQVNIVGNVQISAQALRTLMDREIPILHFTPGGYFAGVTRAHSHKNIELRLRQFEAAREPATSLAIARQFVWGKIKNTRTILRRNTRLDVTEALDHLNMLAAKVTKVPTLDALMGYEGLAAKVYFGELPKLLRSPNDVEGFTFEGRNRRPPADPVNALLSFLYGVLCKELTVTSQAVGFDPYLGYLHQPRYGKPALALDLAEEFRPIIADSIVLQLVNTGEVSRSDFLIHSNSCALTTEGRRKVIAAYERRLATEITHPTFGYAISYRRAFEVQARLLARYLSGEIPEYPPFRTR